MVQIDHVGIAAHDARTSARTLSAILGVGEPTADGADGDMYRVDLAHGAFLLFNPAALAYASTVDFVSGSLFSLVATLSGRRCIASGPCRHPLG